MKMSSSDNISRGPCLCWHRSTTASSSRDKQRAGQELVEAKAHLSERFVSHMPTGGHAVLRYDLRAARREGGFEGDLAILEVVTRVNLLPAVWEVRVLPVLLRSATGGSAWSCRQHCAVPQLAPESHECTRPPSWRRDGRPLQNYPSHLPSAGRTPANAGEQAQAYPVCATKQTRT